MGDGLYGAWPVHRGVPHFLHDVGGEVGPRSELTLKGSPNLERCGSLTGRLLFFCCIIGSWEALYPLREFADHGEEVFVTPRDRGRGPTQSIWRSDQGKSFLSFAVGLGGLGLPVETGNTPGILLRIPPRLAACQASMLLA